MKVLLLSDLHGNITATKAMDREIREISPDRVIFLGDAVGKGPSNDETLDWVRSHCDLIIGGNWDFGVGGKMFPADDFFWNQLGEERLAFLNNLPSESELVLSGYRFRLIHGRPLTNLMKGFDPDESLVSECRMSDGTETDGLIFGDSHRPFYRIADGKQIINTGSVGNNLGGFPHAFAILLEGKEECTERSAIRVTVINVPYDRSEEMRIAAAKNELPKQDAYLKEIETGHYGRKMQ